MRQPSPTTLARLSRPPLPLLLLALCAVATRADESPAPASVPAAAECALQLPVQAFTLPSALGETRRINVYLPPGYGEDAATRFPVLYMPDGGLAEDFVHVADAVHAGISWGTLRPLIVVGIENTERRRDMTGPTEVESDGKIAPRVGGSAAFRAFLRDELKPEVARRYRTSDETAIIGESLAGLFVLETFLLEPELFDAYVAISPSVWWNGGRLVDQAAERLAAPRPGATLYLTSADEDNIVPAVGRLAATLAARAPTNLTWYHHPMPDQYHDTIYRAAAPKALRILFPPASRVAAPAK